MWLRDHSDGTFLVHRSPAFVCHSSPARPDVPTNEYHGFNNSKRSCSVYSSILFFYSGIIPQNCIIIIIIIIIFVLLIVLLFYFNLIFIVIIILCLLHGLELARARSELWVELLIRNQSKFGCNPELLPAHAFGITSLRKCPLSCDYSLSLLPPCRCVGNT